MRERERQWERQRAQVPAAQTSPQTAGRSESLAGICRMQIAGTTQESLFMFPSMKYMVGYVAEQVTCRIKPRNIYIID